MSATLTATGRNLRGVDRNQSIVYGVKILGFTSENGRVYERKAIAEAIHMYNQCPVNKDHITEAPSFSDRIGWLSSPRLEADGLYADFHYNPHAEGIDSFLWFAENDGLGDIGFSHMIQGKWTLDADGTERVVRIDRVRSVDLVANPATTKTIFESETPNKEISEMDAANMMKEENPMKALAKEDDIAPAPDTTSPSAEPAKEEPNLELLSKIVAVLSGEGSVEEKSNGVLEACGLKTAAETTDVTNTSKTGGTPAQAKLQDDPDADDDDEDKTEAVDLDKALSRINESRLEDNVDALKTQLNELEAYKKMRESEDKINALLAEHKLESTPVFIRQLCAIGEDSWSEAIEDRKKIAFVRNSVKPVSSVEIRGEPNYKQFVESVLGK